MNTAIAAALLRENMDEVADVAFRLVRKLRPSFEANDEVIATASIQMVLHTMLAYMETQDEEPLLRTVTQLVALRRRGGLNEVDFTVMSHCYMPPVRQVLTERAETREQGLLAYEIIEGYFLPLLERMFQMIWSTTVTDSTEPDGEPVTDEPMRPVFVRELLAGKR